MNGDGSSGSHLSLQLANLLKNGLNQQPQNPKLSDNLQINLKLNSQNHALWTRMIRVAIDGKSKSLLSHLTTDPPDQTSEDYEQWEQEDLIVFSWLIQNIEPALTGNLTEYPTAKMLWDSLVVTYSGERDKLQTFNLHVKANDIKQNNNSLEDFWISLQGIWGEIDRIDPNPMKCLEDIKTYSKIRSEQKLFQFLNAFDRRYEPIKREILRLKPLPSAEVAYATVRKEAAHQNILGATINDTQGIAACLIATETDVLGLVLKVNRRSDRRQIGSSSRDIRTGAIIGCGTEIKGLYYLDDVTQNGAVMLSHGTGIAGGLIATETEVLGLVSKVNRRSDCSQIGSSSWVDKSKLKCGEYGMTNIPKKDALDLSATSTGGSMAPRRASRTLDHKKAKPLLPGAPRRTPTPITKKISLDLGGGKYS
nr:putative Gag-polypeptide of LTR copia-type [Tanacetum cinerariifolium]